MADLQDKPTLSNTQVEEYQPCDEEETHFRDEYESDREFSKKYNREHGYEDKTREEQIEEDEKDILCEYNTLVENIKDRLNHFIDIYFDENSDELDYCFTSVMEEDEMDNDERKLKDAPLWYIKYVKTKSMESHIESMEELFPTWLNENFCNWTEKARKFFA